MDTPASVDRYALVLQRNHDTTTAYRPLISTPWIVTHTPASLLTVCCYCGDAVTRRVTPCSRLCSDTAYCSKVCRNKDYDFHILNCHRASASLEFVCDLCARMVTPKQVCAGCNRALLCRDCKNAVCSSSHQHLPDITERRAAAEAAAQLVAALPDDRYVVVTIHNGEQRAEAVSADNLRALARSADRFISIAQKHTSRRTPFLLVCRHTGCEMYGSAS